MLTTPPARRDMALPSKVALAVVTFVDQRLAGNPQRLSKVFGELTDLHSARNGDYRVLLGIDDHAPLSGSFTPTTASHAYCRG